MTIFLVAVFALLLGLGIGGVIGTAHGVNLGREVGMNLITRVIYEKITICKWGIANILTYVTGQVVHDEVEEEVWLKLKSLDAAMLLTALRHFRVVKEQWLRQAGLWDEDAFQKQITRLDNIVDRLEDLYVEAKGEVK